LRARGQRVPNLSCLSLDPCRHLCPGGRAAQDCCTSARSGLRPNAHERGVRNYSAKSRFTAGRDFEAYGSSLSATARIVASPSPTRAFTFELSDHESPLWYVEHNYAAKQSIAAAGLSPARQAAVWAASASRDIPTGCKDEVAAEGVANDRRRRAELVKAGTIKPAEDAVADHAKLPLNQHFTAYLAHVGPAKK